MLIRFDATPDRVRYTAAYRRHLRRMFLPYRGTGLVLGLLAVFALIPEPRIVAPVLAGVGVLFFFFSPALMLHRAVEAGWRRNGVPSSWEITDEGLRCATELGDGMVRWQAVARVEQLTGQLMVLMRSGPVMFVPTVDLSAEQRDELTAFIRERGLLTGQPASDVGTGRGASEPKSDG